MCFSEFRSFWLSVVSYCIHLLQHRAYNICKKEKCKFELRKGSHTPKMKVEAKHRGAELCSIKPKYLPILRSGSLCLVGAREAFKYMDLTLPLVSGYPQILF